MDNQHRKIAGYRELDQGEIDLMNKIKEIGPALEALCEEVASDLAVDRHWLGLGKEQLQTGLMCLTRAVAQPTSF